VKNWREIRKKLTEVFSDDYIKYDMKEAQFEIASKNFVMEEFDKLIKLCKKNSLWFFCEVVPDKKFDICSLVVYKI